MRTVQCSAVQYSAVQCSAAQCSTVQYSQCCAASGGPEGSVGWTGVTERRRLAPPRPLSSQAPAARAALVPSATSRRHPEASKQLLLARSTSYVRYMLHAAYCILLCAMYCQGFYNARLRNLGGEQKTIWWAMEVTQSKCRTGLLQQMTHIH